VRVVDSGEALRVGVGAVGEGLALDAQMEERLLLVGTLLARSLQQRLSLCRVHLLHYSCRLRAVEDPLASTLQVALIISIIAISIIASL